MYISTNSLKLCLSEKGFLFPSLLKDNYSGFRILGFFFFSQCFEYFMPFPSFCLFVCLFVWEEVFIHRWHDHLWRIPIVAYKALLELISEFSKVAGHTVSVKKSVMSCHFLLVCMVSKEKSDVILGWTGNQWVAWTPHPPSGSDELQGAGQAHPPSYGYRGWKH